MDKEAKAKMKRRELIPEIVEEVKAQTESVSESAGAIAEETSSKVIEAPVKEESVTKRTSDSFDLSENISQYIQGIIKLRDGYANRLYVLLVVEVIAMFTIVFLYGFGVIQLEGWLVTIIAESILVKTFLSVQIIVKNLFPNKSLIELLLKGGASEA